MTLLVSAAAPRSNLTDADAKILHRRAAYVAAHRQYFDYLRHLLDTATLPASDVPLPNMTTMAAMVAEMRAMHPTAPRLNGVTLGRVLHRVLPSPLLTWHGGRHVTYSLPSGSAVFMATTVYRFSEVQKARWAFKFHSKQTVVWHNNYDQWQAK